MSRGCSNGIIQGEDGDTRMTRNKLLTVALLFGFAGLAISWDLYVYFYGDNADMISNAIWVTSSEHPALPFLFGFLMGHLFWGKGKDA